ncbi:MAG: folate-binding protein YgfZ [Xanthomonadaceae bacterium]|nr:folate-binding protein YgfZ [Xanthomonadaceae bacterium]
MPDNPQSIAAPYFALPDHRVLTLIGRDAIAFAQAQFMNDVGTLTPGYWQWNGWLTPKGRLIALFALVIRDAETVYLLLPDADPAMLAMQLQRFVFRSKVVISPSTQLSVSGSFNQSPDASGNRVSTLGDNMFELDVGGEMGFRTLRIGDSPAHFTRAEAERWRATDFAYGLPRLAESQSGQWTPQQLSLERLHAYSVKKGCYPGQEIVARTHFLGQAKRGLALFEAAINVAEGAEIHGDAQQALGTVVGVAQHGGDCLALAVLPLSRDPGPLRAGDVALTQRAMVDGLAR